MYSYILSTLSIEYCNICKYIYIYIYALPFVNHIDLITLKIVLFLIMI